MAAPVVDDRQVLAERLFLVAASLTRSRTA
jgi:hypothetical protein